MSDVLLAQFQKEEDLRAAASAAIDAGHPALDALCHKPVEGLSACLAPAHGKPPVGWLMFAAGALGAAAGYFLQWYSAVIDYPIDSGGRPLHSWPVFLLVPYEAAILSAAIVGLLSWLWLCGLPKLFHPLFAAPIVERASQDLFILIFPSDPATRNWVKRHLHAFTGEGQ